MDVELKPDINQIEGMNELDRMKKNQIDHKKI